MDKTKKSAAPHEQTLNKAPKLYQPSNQPQGDAVRLHLNENPYGPPKECWDILTAKPELALHQYPQGGNSQLEQTLAQLHRVKLENILVDNGSSEVLKQIFFSLAKTSQKILLPSHGWAYFNTLVHLNDFQADYYPLSLDKRINRFSFDMEDLQSRILQDQPDILMIVSPNAFTGNLLGAENLKKLLDLCGDQTTVVVDQAYTEYSYQEDILPSEFITQYPNIIFSRTLSKFYALANLRIGYAIAQESFVQKIKASSNLFGVSALSQSIAAKALEFPQHYEKVKRDNARIKNLFLERISTLRHFTAYRSEANFVLIKVNGLEAGFVHDQVRQKGIVLGKGTHYGLDQYLRVTIGKGKEMDRLFSILQGLDA